MRMNYVDVGAQISEDGRHRTRLWRAWSTDWRMLFIMLNPSTADATRDDPTIRKCVGFAKQHGAGGIEVVNLYTLRTPSPDVLFDAPVASRNMRENGQIIHSVAHATERNGGLIVCAWGADKRAEVVAQHTRRLLAYRNLWALRITKDGRPAHPLYLPYSSTLKRFAEDDRYE